MGFWKNEAENGSTFLTFVENNAAAELDSVTVGMLINNNITCFARCIYFEMDEERSLRFDMTGITSYREYVRRYPEYKRISAVIRSAAATLVNIRKYMIRPECICAAIDDLYVDTGEQCVVFMPELELSRQKPLVCQSFFREMILAAVSAHPENPDKFKFYDLMSFIAGESISPDRIVEYIEGESAEKYGASGGSALSARAESRSVSGEVAAGIEKAAVSVMERAADIVNNIAEEKPDEQSHENGGKKSIADIFGLKKNKPKAEKASQREKKKPASVMADFAIPGQDSPAQTRREEPAEEPLPAPAPKEAPKEKRRIPLPKRAFEKKSAPVRIEEDNTFSDMTEIEGDADETQIEMENNPRLVDLRTKKAVEIDREMFSIGRDPKEMNDLIINNKYIGRRHAYLIRRGGRWYIVDNHSKNHTYVNGRMILSGEEQAVPLESGDVIKLSSEEFVFEL